MAVDAPVGRPTGTDFDGLDPGVVTPAFLVWPVLSLGHKWFVQRCAGEDGWGSAWLLYIDGAGRKGGRVVGDKLARMGKDVYIIYQKTPFLLCSCF